MPCATRLLCERARDVRLSRSGRAGDDHVRVRLDPRARRKLADQPAIQIALTREIEVLDARVRHAQSSFLQRRRDALVVTRQVLRIDQKAEARVEVELVAVSVLALRPPRVGHGVHA